jgi:hypothetical protein
MMRRLCCTSATFPRSLDGRRFIESGALFSNGPRNIQWEVSPNLPMPRSAFILKDLHNALGGASLLHRFPRATLLDTAGWVSQAKVGSSEVRDCVKKYRRPGAIESDMCADDNYTLIYGEPPPGSLVDYPMAWGVISCFVPIGKRGRAAWRYVREAVALLHGLPCHETLDPSISCGYGGIPLRYVIDRSIGRAWNELGSAGYSQLADRAEFPDDNGLRVPLAHHVLVTVASPTPSVQLEQISMCRGWDMCSPLDTDITEDTISVPQLGLDAPTSGAEVPVNELWIRDQQLRDADRLLEDCLVHVRAPLHLCIEALLYSYLFQHHQAHFAGRLDRVFALDGGRCAELLVAAGDLAFPGGNYGRDEWARMYADPIVREARVFLSRAEDSTM